MTVTDLIQELQSLSKEALSATVVSYDAGHKYPIVGVATQHNKQGEIEVVLD